MISSDFRLALAINALDRAMQSAQLRSLGTDRDEQLRRIERIRDVCNKVLKAAGRS